MPDLCPEFADHYLDALDGVADGGGVRAGRGRQQRAEDLSAWHLLLLRNLVGSDSEDRLDRLAGHRALAGPELTYLQARIADERGDRELARGLIQESLESLPGHRGFREFRTRDQRADSGAGRTDQIGMAMNGDE